MEVMPYSSERIIRFIAVANDSLPSRIYTRMQSIYPNIEVLRYFDYSGSCERLHFEFRVIDRSSQLF